MPVTLPGSAARRPPEPILFESGPNIGIGLPVEKDLKAIGRNVVHDPAAVERKFRIAFFFRSGGGFPIAFDLPDSLAEAADLLIVAGKFPRGESRVAPAFGGVKKIPGLFPALAAFLHDEINLGIVAFGAADNGIDLFHHLLKLSAFAELFRQLLQSVRVIKFDRHKGLSSVGVYPLLTGTLLSS